MIARFGNLDGGGNSAPPAASNLTVTVAVWVESESAIVALENGAMVAWSVVAWPARVPLIETTAMTAPIDAAPEGGPTQQFVFGTPSAIAAHSIGDRFPGNRLRC